MEKNNRFIFELFEKPNFNISTTYSRSTKLNESKSSSSTDDISDSSDSEEDDLLLFLMRFLMNNKRKRHIENYLDIVDSWSDLEFKEHLRISRRTAVKLIGIVLKCIFFKYI